jgi:hypothetical protein
VGEERPLLCLVGGAQWMDRASAQTLAFVARRLLADSVAAVVATREPIEELAGQPELLIEGLGNGDARAARLSTARSAGRAGAATGSSPRPGVTRWRCWSCRVG